MMHKPPDESDAQKMTNNFKPLCVILTAETSVMLLPSAWRSVVMMTITFSRSQMPALFGYTVKGQTLSRIDCIKDIGVFLDSDLRFKTLVFRYSLTML